MRALPLVALAVLLETAVPAQKPLFSFGAIADVQYADKNDTIGRHYRASTAKLAACANLLYREKLEFVIELGDLIDEGAGTNLAVIQRVYEQIQAPRYFVLGNHDLTMPRSELLPALGLRQPYYEFTRQGWTFVVLDGMNESVAGGWPAGDPHEQAGRATLESLRKQGVPNAQTWNGAAGPEQRAWLRDVLSRSRRAIVFGHFPVFPAACRPEHLLWDHEEVFRILETSPAVQAYFSGHDHKGGEAAANGILHLTLPGMVEHAVNESCQVVDVFSDALVLRQAGAATGRRYRLR